MLYQGFALRGFVWLIFLVFHVDLNSVCGAKFDFPVVGAGPQIGALDCKTGALLDKLGPRS